MIKCNLDSCDKKATPDTLNFFEWYAVTSYGTGTDGKPNPYTWYYCCQGHMLANRNKSWQDLEGSSVNPDGSESTWENDQFSKGLTK